ncbi:hypothetical protein [Vibrio natriegens]|uniref:hypothetical protein n=1 Tax=Vibrio natriegens TaxID=691 RepID=UPI0018C8A5CB|nr:hypothetical protein [Vibrio natriegens]
MPPNQVPAWVSDAEEHYEEFKLHRALRKYWAKHDPASEKYSFSELYSPMTAGQIALNISFIRRD